MALAPRLDLRHSQKLVMTPQLQQAIKLLQLSNIELTQYVEQELEQNPLLERADGAEDDGASSGDEVGEGGGEEAGEGDSPADGDAAQAAEPTEPTPTKAEDALDTDYDNVWNNDSPADAPTDAVGAGAGSDAWLSRGRGREGDGGDLDQTIADHVSLRDHLIAQVNVDLVAPAERLVALELVELLDDSGYLIADLGEVATRLGCGRSLVDSVVSMLQRLDPPGIFARDLAECLALQLRDRNRFDPAMAALVANLELLARRDIGALLAICGVDQDDLTEMVAELRALDPKPAQRFEPSVAQPVTPDVVMRPTPKGGWIVELNSDTLPRVLVNERYYAEVSSRVRKPDEREYISERFQAANWLVKSLHQRATTILKVSSELVRQQDSFFRKGVEHLRPLVLRDIAEAIEMHESTVSRVTANKYISTPRGIFELKYFFTNSIASASGGEAHSAEAVRFRIKTLIDAESDRSVLSDDRIVDLLRGDGIDIARRTVAKYREAMRIPSSVQRRREKASQLAI